MSGLIALRGRFVLIRVGLLVPAVLATLLLSQLLGGEVAGATSTTLSIDAATFSQITDADATTHFAAFCGMKLITPGREFQGTTNFIGGATASVNLPQGATVTALRVSVGDNDTDLNVTAYLVRKRIAASSTLDTFDGYTVMAQATSSGADSHIRTFSDTSIVNAAINNTNFAYYVELLNCADTTDPIGVQIVYSH